MPMPRIYNGGICFPSQDMDDEQQDRPVRKVACTECRQQKVKCDMNKPCSRCKKFNLECAVSAPFKRTSKRSKLEELEEETRRLRRRLDAVASPSVVATTTTSGTAAPSSQQSPPSASARSEDGLPTSTTTNINSPQTQRYAVPAVPSAPSAASAPPTPIAESQRESRPNLLVPPTPRELDGLKLDSSTISDLFSIYFSRYHRLCPVADPQLSPDATYECCQFLFWMICAIGSRRYKKIPDLSQSFGTRIVNLPPPSQTLGYSAFSSAPPSRLISLATKEMQTVPANGHFVKGLLLLSTWPFFKDHTSFDIMFALVAAMLHIGIRIGMHVPQATQDFIRFKVNVTEEKILKRAELWAHCVVAYQRYCLTQGVAPLEPVVDSDWNKKFYSILPRETLAQVRIQRLAMRASTAVLENGLDFVEETQKRAFRIIMKMFLSEANELQADPSIASSSLMRLYLEIVRMHILCFYTLQDWRELDALNVAHLYTSACTTIHTVIALEMTYWHEYDVPLYIYHGFMFATFVLLRLWKSPLRAYIEETESKDLILDAISRLPKMSIGPNDIMIRMSIILTALWNSDRSFKNPDGTSLMKLRIRSRLGASLVYDCVWWWREEFSDLSGWYTKPEWARKAAAFKEAAQNAANSDPTQSSQNLGVDGDDNTANGTGPSTLTATANGIGNNGMGLPLDSIAAVNAAAAAAMGTDGYLWNLSPEQLWTDLDLSWDPNLFLGDTANQNLGNAMGNSLGPMGNVPGMALLPGIGANSLGTGDGEGMGQ